MKIISASFIDFDKEFEKLNSFVLFKCFSNKVSKDLVFATILGAVELAKKESNTKSLIKSVSSKRGTTEAALKVLEKSNAGLYTLMRKAIYAAKDRANEISKSI